MSWLVPRPLSGARVCLEPLRPDHVLALDAAAGEQDLSTLWYTHVPPAATVGEMVRDRLTRLEQGTWAPYAIFRAESEEAIGMSGYLNVRVLRSHFDPFARARDTCVYRIIDGEWASVKRHLTWRLSRYGQSERSSIEAA